jgi:hypothetical protein
MPAPAKREPLEAEPGRRVLHTVLAMIGWVLFAYWWWLVFRRVNATEVRYTLWFIGIALAVITLVTALWALHNLRVARRFGPRTKMREVREDFSRDTVGRPVTLPAVPHECLTAPFILVRIEDGTKVYESRAAGGRTPAPGLLKVVP